MYVLNNIQNSKENTRNFPNISIVFRDLYDIEVRENRANIISKVLLNNSCQRAIREERSIIR